MKLIDGTINNCLTRNCFFCDFFCFRFTGNTIEYEEEEKQLQIQNLENFQKSHADKSEQILHDLQIAAINQENLFAKMMEAVKYCSLGQITNALFEVGGMYRRNM